MGASTSAQSPGEEVEDAEEKQLQKNGQISISSLNEKTDDQTDINGHAEDDTLAEIGQTDAMPQKEDSPESIEVLQDEVSPQVNGDQEEDKSISVDKTTSVSEEKVEDKPNESNEVGFKKIFRFVGFKFTLKKDKNEKAEPVQLLTVKETDDGASEAATAEESKEEAATEEEKPEKESAPDAPETEKEATTEDAVQAEAVTDLAATDAPAEVVKDSVAEPEQQQAEEVETAQEKESAEEVATTPEKEKEAEVQTESSSSPPSQETPSPFKRFFTQGIFSNLRKKTSFKKSKDEEAVKEKPLEEDITETEEKAEEAVAEDKEVKEEAEEEPKSEQVEESAPTEENKAEASPEIVPSTTEEQKAEEEKVQVEVTSEPEPPQEAEPVAQTTTSEVTEIPVADTVDEAKPINDTKPTEDKPEESVEQAPQSPEIEATAEPELVSSQEKPKAQGSPLKKLFTGAGLKKLSSKKQKSKKEAEAKLTESGEQVAEQIQSSTESAEPQKPDSGPSSPEDSGEHAVGEVSQASQAEATAEGESEAVTSDSEKKKDGIIPWSSFKKLVTPKKRVKRPSESEDEAPADKPKSATLSSTESATIEDKPEETKPSEEVKDEAKEEESQAEPKTETKAEKLEQSTEEPKKKMDTSVSWEALICVGSSKKRARKTSDSDDDETKIEEEVQPSVEEQVKTAESPIVSSQEAEHETLASSPEPEGEPVSTWESFKRLVTHRKKPKAEDKSDEASGPEQTTSDSEAPKEESSFSFRKLIPRRKKKSDSKHDPSSDVGSAEEDSDTPAVVPLSEYENEQSEKAETEKKEEPIVEEVEATPVKAAAEDRSPSWISAAVENAEEEADGKQLSDIPEEGDTAATPKSTDNTIAEDIVEFTSEAVTALEQAEETEMVSAVSRITASPVTSGETTPVPGDGVVEKAESILQEAVETINVTSSAMAVTVTQEQETVTVVDSTVVESGIIEEKVVLVSHEKTEATTICTGLDTSEIKAVEEESPVKASVESVTVVAEVVSVEVAVEDQTPKAVEAGVDEQKVCEAQINEVQTDYKEQLQAPIENAVEEPAQLEAVEETPAAETVHELQATATAVKAAVVTAVQQEAQILEEPLVAENSPKLETEGPIEPSVEESVCAQTVEVTEVAVAEGEKVQELKDVDESVASVVVASVEGLAVAVSEEITPSLADTPIVEITEAQEDAIPVVAQTEESAVTEEVICVSQAIVSFTESEVKEEIVMEEVPPVESTSEHKIEVAVKEIEIVSAKVEVEGHIEVASSKVSAVVEEACKKVQEEVTLSQAVDVKEVEAIQEQSTVIVQEVIQNVVENLSELCMKKETTEKPEESLKPEDKPAASETSEEKATVSVPTVEVTPSVDVTVQAEKSEPEAPVQEEKPVDDVAVQEEKPAVEASAEAEKPAVEAPVEEEKPAVEAPVEEEKPAVEAPVEEEKPAVEAPVEEEKPAVEAPVEEEKPSAETISEKPLTSDTENKADELKTRVVTEPSLIEVSEAVQISETVPVALTDKIQPEKEEIATVSVDAVQQYTDVVKQEVELKEVEKPVEEKTVVESTGSEEGKCQVENDLKEVSETIQQVTTEKSSDVTQIVTVVSTMQAQVIEEQCQIETTSEINVGIVNVVDADGETATTLKEDCSENQKPEEDRPQTALEESQNEVSTTDVKKCPSGDATCQKTEAKAIEVKMAVEETVNAIKEEEVTEEVVNDIDPVSTEIATVS
ncbi:A-kinase anchor protein 12 isoform X1 [Astyanax mexicanus]|uniref:A-kinase anchor protein 12 isoform X1 n=1 Tax=Astyanax mexicanus TaxID=7994 RepID=A0A8T2MG60_ASTMX|nr:A-kinase anchor protein 12 isoform X1 [Astyanax mexicanus]